jgi:hypothetical protein
MMPPAPVQGKRLSDACSERPARVKFHEEGSGNSFSFGKERGVPEHVAEDVSRTSVGPRFGYLDVRFHFLGFSLVPMVL